MPGSDIQTAYHFARERYSTVGVDADAALAALRVIPLSLHCWQGDDLSGFENSAGLTGGGIQATGNYPGKARNADELRADLDQAFALIPGKHRVNLHAIYAEVSGKRVERDQLAPEHFARWIDWAKSQGLGLDFNPTFFSHPLAAAGFTLSSRDESIRKFWIRHGVACRKIGEHFGRTLNTPCVTNVWIPDGSKDLPADRAGPRARLQQSLDELFAAPTDPRHNRDALEGKLFGLGLESYTVGSHEFYLGYAARHQKILCLDMGHFHPTESVADKISAVLAHVPELLLHVSRGVRWDSDHVVLLTDELSDVAAELVRGGFLPRTHIGLDYFDASINRIAAWVIGTRAVLKALLRALLEPSARLVALEAAEDLTGRLALMEEAKSLPAGAVWDYYCQEQNVPSDAAWLETVKAYERTELARR